MKKLVVANWKMNPLSQKEAESLFLDISKMIKANTRCETVICPPPPYLFVPKKLKIKNIILGAQNVSYETKGAFTGEISPLMLRDLGVKYAIVGHSERRSLGETDEIINKKILALIKVKITPIICVGESVRNSNAEYFAIVRSQLMSCLAGIKMSNLKDIVIAYEPVWALSSTINRHDATPHDFEEMKIYIRKILTDLYTVGTAKNVRIIYGGSVSKDNAESFLISGADGLLPGKASLDRRNFSAILEIANKHSNSKK